MLPSLSAFLPPVMPARGMMSSSAMRMSAGSDYVATLPGAPFGDGAIFDPLNLSAGASPEDIKKWREAELKHGRVSMLAALGILVAEVSSVVECDGDG